MTAHFKVPKLKIGDKLGNYLLFTILSPLVLAMILIIIKFEMGVNIPIFAITYLGIPAALFMFIMIIFGGAGLWLYKSYLRTEKKRKRTDVIHIEAIAWVLNAFVIGVIMNLYLDEIHPFREINDSFAAMIAVSLFIGYLYGQLIKFILKNRIEFVDD